MKLQDRLPDGVTVDGRFYKCDFDFRNVLKMLEIIRRDDLELSARDYHCVKCVFSGHLPLSKAANVYLSICSYVFITISSTHIHSNQTALLFAEINPPLINLGVYLLFLKFFQFCVVTLIQ